MKKSVVGVFICILLFIAACSSGESGSVEKVNKKDEEKKEPSVEEREKWVSSRLFIKSFTLDKSDNEECLVITVKDDFGDKSISEQYLSLVDFYEEYNDKFGTTLEGGYLDEMQVNFSRKSYPTYSIEYQVSYLVAISLGVERKSGEKPKDIIIDTLDKLDKETVMSGKIGGLTEEEEESGKESTIEGSMITRDGELAGDVADSESFVYNGFDSDGSLSSGSATTSGSVSEDDSETEDSHSNNSYEGTGTSDDTEIDLTSINGNEWIKLTDNQKFHGVSNVLYILEQRGYTITQDESFFIAIIDAFYTNSPAAMDMQVSAVLTSEGAMLGGITAGN
ncbi:hypothetical protein [Bacillus sp. D386]|uniref:hypothetical protein n=1 Tax=Bacillus sp. D386 TaxID=2587155 RepID=UPI00111E26FE|nr:hypothetical protein [Bacillus sp. D386]